MIELSGIIILGILAQWSAWKFKIPAILPLILIGLLVGPVASEWLSSDGTKWIEPVWNGEKGLFPGESLYYFVSLAISLILFEGGLTLKLNEIKNVGPVITKLITIGSAVTFWGAGFAVHFIFDLSWQVSFLFSALIIVTGPTVITPILRNIPLKKDISAVLKWEGILIDPIGALVAVLVFEFINVGTGTTYTKTAFVEFGKIVLFGSTFGFTFAHALGYAIRRKLIPHYLLNVFVLASVLGIFVLSDTFSHESGLLSVVVMGMVLGNSNLPHLNEILDFKESISVLLISILFILLAANVNWSDLMLIYNWKTLAIFLIVVFVIRPLGVFLSSINSTLKFNEKLFISWVGPRGIVAAGIASLFGLKLVKNNVEGAEYITPLVFVIVLGTVLFNATTARLFAKISKVFLQNSNGILIIGASKFSRLIAEYLNENDQQVVLMDSNIANIEKAKKMGLDASLVDIYSDELIDNIELSNIGFLIALTGNAEINKYAIQRFKKQFGENGVFRIRTHDEIIENPRNSNLMYHKNDYVSVMEVANQFPTVQEVPFTTKEEYIGLIRLTEKDADMIPLFVKYPDGHLDIITYVNKTRLENIKPGTSFVYLGKEIENNS
ncbi:sodium:proton antiporter [Flavicella sp.]|uniref:cation:proton antiporter n=1 Tax=Flavicella sp. TaxID=2957742 RepID=UPI00260B3692|nr:sodium:proton antiporter [Flavicella sp.]MDG1804939.1 cation:proton antiporter [Flavicella sp.]MDG2279397.1 cation:proton antiporter [Flavicella sp.]